jgi:RNA polymerase sigma-70 factor (ECF subfamily)
MPEASLEELVARCGRGDVAALGALYDQLGRTAYALARRITRDAKLAEEVVEQAFLDAWRGARSVEPGRGTVVSWLLAFVHRRAVDAVRDPARRARLLQGAEETPAAASVVDDDAARIRRAALARLAPDERRVLELAYLDGMAQSEIAELLGEPLPLVTAKMHVALQNLRKLLEPAST